MNKEFYCVQYGNEGNLSANVASQDQKLFLGGNEWANKKIKSKKETAEANSIFRFF